jgi:heme A synthase
MVVGLLQIGLTILLWRRRKDLRWLGVGALVLVCAQGTLGALTVAFKLPWAISTLHLLTAQAYVALLVYLAYRTRQTPTRASDDAVARITNLKGWIAAGAGLILAQIVLGGLMRHNGGALASVQFPLHDGSLWPAGAPIALKLHMAHRIFGVVAGLFAVAVAGAVFRQAKGWTAMRLLAAATPLLIATQVLLGAVTILYMRPVAVVVGHFAVGISLWIAWFSMALMARRAGGAR